MGVAAEPRAYYLVGTLQGEPPVCFLQGFARPSSKVPLDSVHCVSVVPRSAFPIGVSGAHDRFGHNKTFAW